MKFCPSCQEEKNEEDFFKNAARKDGLASYCKKCKVIADRKSFLLYRERREAKQKQWRKANNEKERASARKNYAKTIEKQRERATVWRNNHKEQEKQRIIKYRHTEKYLTNVQVKLRDTLRARLRRVLKGKQKNASAVADLGCSIQELKQHIENQWQPGMSWDNWTTDGWHIDHIKPFSKFDLTNAEQQKLAVHYTNLQPLWAKDNLQKHNKF